MAYKFELVGATLTVAATAVPYTMGDNHCWKIPPLGNIAYRTWAVRKDFEIGDTISNLLSLVNKRIDKRKIP